LGQERTSGIAPFINDGRRLKQAEDQAMPHFSKPSSHNAAACGNGVSLNRFNTRHRRSPEYDLISEIPQRGLLFVPEPRLAPDQGFTTSICKDMNRNNPRIPLKSMATFPAVRIPNSNWSNLFSAEDGNVEYAKNPSTDSCC
jgi:hypothetical protein